MPPFAPSATRTPGSNRFAEAAAESLSAVPRRLPSEFLYDALGSALFDAISNLPWYPVTRAESALLAAHASEIAALAADVSSIVDLGPGSGDKLATLLHALPDASDRDVHLVDVSQAALDEASRRLRSARMRGNLRLITHLATYGEGARTSLDDRAAEGRALILFLGSNIGNFDRDDADAFLCELRRRQRPGDRLLLGADLVKPEAELVRAYDDPLGVSAAFNLNVLIRANRELGANFALEGFSHRAVWNEAESRMEMSLVSVARQRVLVPASGLDITFEPGDTIWTESSHKYTAPAILDMLARAGFSTVAQWVDNGFALTMGEAV